MRPTPAHLIAGILVVIHLDCFVLSDEPLVPQGILRSQEMDAARAELVGANRGWFPFEPAVDPFTNSPIDLRFLNEDFAGQHGFIGTDDGRFIHTDTGRPVRFWAVNGPPG